MGRIRTIKPEFFTHEELSALPAETHLFAAGLLTYADDEGYFNAHPLLVKAAVFPLRECSLSPQCMFTELSNVGFLRFGKTPDGKRWGQVVNFQTHQVVNRATVSKIRDLPIVWEDSVRTHGALTEDSVPEGKGKEGNREGNRESLPPPPRESSVTTQGELTEDSRKAHGELPKNLGLTPLSPQAATREISPVAPFPGAGPPPKPTLLPSRVPPASLEQFVEVWNQHCGNLSQVRDLTGPRRKRVATRQKRGLTLERFREAVVCCATKPFLCGKGPAGWRADFDWLLENDQNVEKVIAEPYGVPGANGHGKLSATQAGVYRPPESPAEIAADRERQEAAHQRYVIGLANSPPKVRADMLRCGQCTQADIDEGFRLVPELARRVQ